MIVMRSHCQIVKLFIKRGFQRDDQEIALCIILTILWELLCYSFKKKIVGYNNFNQRSLDILFRKREFPTPWTSFSESNKRLNKWGFFCFQLISDYTSSYSDVVGTCTYRRGKSFSISVQTYNQKKFCTDAIIFQTVWHFASARRLKFSHDDHNKDNDWIFNFNEISISNTNQTIQWPIAFGVWRAQFCS